MVINAKNLEDLGKNSEAINKKAVNKLINHPHSDSPVYFEGLNPWDAEDADRIIKRYEKNPERYGPQKSIPDEVLEARNTLTPL